MELTFTNDKNDELRLGADSLSIFTELQTAEDVFASGQLAPKNEIFEDITNIIDDLRSVVGLTEIHFLEEYYKEIIDSLEESNNVGVRDCLEKDVVLVAVHNSKFRAPPGQLVVRENGAIKFPSLPFEELKKFGAVSSSPSEKVHWFLSELFGMILSQEHSTLLVGFDL